jgi:hypothetical protein
MFLYFSYHIKCIYLRKMNKYIYDHQKQTLTNPNHKNNPIHNTIIITLDIK